MRWGFNEHITNFFVKEVATEGNPVSNAKVGLNIVTRVRWLGFVQMTTHE